MRWQKMYYAGHRESSADRILPPLIYWRGKLDPFALLPQLIDASIPLNSSSHNESYSNAVHQSTASKE